MSTKHFFPPTTNPSAHLVPLAQSSFSARHPNLRLLPKSRVLYNPLSSTNKTTALVSGGGAGHEPAWHGYVGAGFLAAAVAGDIFACPSAGQVLAAIRAVAPRGEGEGERERERGVILCITNYTGDRLHFGLARERALALGIRCEVVVMAEDAALPRGNVEAEGRLGRRGLVGNLVLLKLLGAASEAGWSFEEVVKLGRLGNDQLVTIGASLDRCHVPGRPHHEPVPADTVEVGMGIHNEPGLRTISPLPSAEDLIKEMLLYLLDPHDKERAFVRFGPGDEVLMLVNNFGGLSPLELEALAEIARQQLENDWHIHLTRIFVGAFETSLNGPGFSITLGNLSGLARAMGPDDPAAITALLDAPTDAPAWPKNTYRPVAADLQHHHPIPDDVEADELDPEMAQADANGPITPPELIPALQRACHACLAAEPLITHFDLQTGDGDCGEAVAGMCQGILDSLASLPDTPIPFFTLLTTHLLPPLSATGGTLAAILTLLLTALTSSLRALPQEPPYFLHNQPTLAALAAALPHALTRLRTYTPARPGDRTVLDALVPFAAALAEPGLAEPGVGDRGLGFEEAVREAQRGARNTRGMRPRCGRAGYLRERFAEKGEGEGEKGEAGIELPPDPGAWALAVWLGGLVGVGMDVEETEGEVGEVEG